MYLCGAVVMFYLLQWSIDWFWGYFHAASLPSEFKITLASAVITVIVGISLYRNERVYTIANEIAGELKKVTWPTAKEVRAATMVVIVMSLISAVILYGFDIIWSFLTEKVYG